MWHILAGEYPPAQGGVADYTAQLAVALSEAGDDVTVWSSTGCGSPPAAGVAVHPLQDRFGWRGLAALGRALRAYGPEHRLLVQYAPRAFGWRGMNILFAAWLLAHRRHVVWVMFHEVYSPWGRGLPFRLNVLGAMTRLTALLVARAAQRIFVSIPYWTRLLRPLVSHRTRIVWLPVPSNIPVVADPGAAAGVRARLTRGRGLVIGHFGGFNRFAATALAAVVPPLLANSPEHVFLLLGWGSVELRDSVVRSCPELAHRIVATGDLASSDLSLHLQACDLLIQPYADGISTRRGTAMAAMAHGVPLVTTSGQLTEPLWEGSGAVLLSPAGDHTALLREAERLTADERLRARLLATAQRLYRERFALEHTIRTLREASSPGGKAILRAPAAPSGSC